MGLAVHRILLIGSENENGDTTNDKLDELSIASEIGLDLEPLQMDFDKLTGHGDESSSRESSSEAGTCFRYSEISESRERERERERALLSWSLCNTLVSSVTCLKRQGLKTFDYYILAPSLLNLRVEETNKYSQTQTKIRPDKKMDAGQQRSFFYFFSCSFKHKMVTCNSSVFLVLFCFCFFFHNSVV